MTYLLTDKYKNFKVIRSEILKVAILREVEKERIICTACPGETYLQNLDLFAYGHASTLRIPDLKQTR